MSSHDTVLMNSIPIPAARSPLRVHIPLYAGRIPAGFPSPAADYIEANIDLNEMMVRDNEATFYSDVKKGVNIATPLEAAHGL